MKRINKTNILFFVIIFQFSQSCKKEEPPQVITDEITSITTSSAMGGGIIISEGSSQIITRGVCWSREKGPTIEKSDRTDDGSGSGIFHSQVTGVDGGTLYYVRAYAINDAGVGYGTDMSFTTLGSAPTVLTKNATFIYANSLKLNGAVNPNLLPTKVAFEYGETTSYGSIVSASSNDIITESFVNASISGLKPNTEYHFRVLAENSVGISKGSDIKVFTSPPPIKDVDGNTYNIVRIGNQLWLKENLKVTHYNDGTPIPNITDISWDTLKKGAYCWLNNDASIKNTNYGAHYNWYAATNNTICPKGWHVPNDEEWLILINFLGGSEKAGGKLKESGLSHWKSPNTGATNESDFFALPSGYCFRPDYFHEHHEFTGFWLVNELSSDQAWYRSLWYWDEKIAKKSFIKTTGFSIRCIQD
jgi:uncharacterized protein (TIGR02145 family)